MIFSRKKQAKAIQVSVNLQVLVGGRMLRASIDARAREGDRIGDLMKHLRRDGEIEPSVVRLVLAGNSAVTLLRNGSRLDMPKGASSPLADGDTLSILTPVAGG